MTYVQLLIDLDSSSDSESDLPSLQTLFPRLHDQSSRYHKDRKPVMPTANTAVRRSPRKHVSAASSLKTIAETDGLELTTSTSLTATSNQRRASPTKRSPAKRSPMKEMRQPPAGAFDSTSDFKSSSDKVLRKVPVLPRSTSSTDVLAASATHNQMSKHKLPHVDSIVLTLNKLNLQDEGLHEDHEPYGLAPGPEVTSDSRSVMSLMTEAAQKPWANGRPLRKDSNQNRETKHKPRHTVNQYILREARCQEDFADSDADNDGEEAETDLSGFLVDDDAELSYHESMDSQVDSDGDIGIRIDRRVDKYVPEPKLKPRRRLVRGRRIVADSDDENNNLENTGQRIPTNAPIHINVPKEHKHSHKLPEVVDLTSSPPPQVGENRDTIHSQNSDSARTNLFDKLQELRLSPPKRSSDLSIPLKLLPSMPSDSRRNHGQEAPEVREVPSTYRYATPPGTPPRSPSKLKSPSKLLSPSKKNSAVPRSPHRPSMDAFWDLNEVNSWTDVHSPRKGPLRSPRKGLDFNVWSDSEDDSFENIEESSDGLPSPCESPSKARFMSPIKSPLKAERQRAQQEKKAKVLKKREFDANKQELATKLFNALDQNVAGGRITELSASTGGVSIIWSKTLRSTAGRANWKRTTLKHSGSPMKCNTLVDDVRAGYTIQHFANIELAEKVIDRQERLYSTLAHEFCHLANFMISGVRDQPHGASFQQWATKATKWLKKQREVPEWKEVTISTKHGYVIEFKYVWACAGRPRALSGKEPKLDIDEEPCGAEYGRHSKSINTEKQRCGVCKGMLVQIRPKPRASPKKLTSGKDITFVKNDIVVLEKGVEIVELSE